MLRFQINRFKCQKLYFLFSYPVCVSVIHLLKVGLRRLCPKWKAAVANSIDSNFGAIFENAKNLSNLNVFAFKKSSNSNEKSYNVCVSVIHPFEGRFEKTVPETEGRGGKLVENGGIAPVVIPLVVAITLNSVTLVLEFEGAELIYCRFLKPTQAKNLASNA